MPVSQYMAKQILDFIGGGAAVTQPGTRWMAFCTGTPNVNGLSTMVGSPVQRVTFAAANSPQGSMTNLNNMTTYTVASTQTAVGFVIYDGSPTGNVLIFGTATAAIGCKGTDNISIAAGALKITVT